MTTRPASGDIPAWPRKRDVSHSITDGKLLLFPSAPNAVLTGHAPRRGKELLKGDQVDAIWNAFWSEASAIY